MVFSLVLLPPALDPGTVVGIHGRLGDLKLQLLGQRTEKGLVGGLESSRDKAKRGAQGSNSIKSFMNSRAHLQTAHVCAYRRL